MLKSEGRQFRARMKKMYKLSVGYEATHHRRHRGYAKIWNLKSQICDSPLRSSVSAVVSPQFPLKLSGGSLSVIVQTPWLSAMVALTGFVRLRKRFSFGSS